ncbi:TPA: hypothetical protein ACOL2D_003193 [Vibrio parahaemolyticus]
MVFEVTRQTKYWPRNSSLDHKYYIKNEMLADCIGIGSGSRNRPNRVSGFNYGKGLGYAYLTYFVSQALGFRRLPFHEDRFYGKYIHKKHWHNSENALVLDADDIHEIVEEVKLIYQHTQKKLKEASLTTVKLRREIAANETGYAETIIKLKDCAELLGRETIQFDMDTLNSFGDEGAYKHLADVTIEHEFPAEDILYCSNLVESKDGRDLMESGEWVVINRSPTGLVELPVGSIKYDSNNWGNKHEITHESAESFFSRYKPLEYRNVTYFEESYGTQGYIMSIRKKISKWLLSNNELV